MEESPPCRVVYMTCEAAGVPYATDKIDLMAGDNMKQDYLKACRVELRELHQVTLICTSIYKNR